MIAGFYSDTNNHVSSFVYSQALGTVDIGNLGPVLAGSGTRYTEAFGENDLGNVVGADFWNSGQEAAFLWTESSGMVEILPPAGVTFDGAYSISDTGIIGANGYYDNGAPAGYRTFVLTPTPEPNSIGASLLPRAQSFFWRDSRGFTERRYARQTRRPLRELSNGMAQEPSVSVD